MKTYNYYIIAGALLAIIGIVGYSFDKSEDSVTLIKFDAQCMEHYKIEEVYIDPSYPFDKGDTILVNENGVIPANPNDEETLDNLHEVILLKQTGTKSFTRDTAELQQ